MKIYFRVPVRIHFSLRQCKKKIESLYLFSILNFYKFYTKQENIEFFEKL